MPMLSLQDIVGQDKAVGHLLRSLAGERMPHAFLFAGPAGVGRRTTATALAATLLCPNRAEAQPSLLASKSAPPPPQPCGTCTDCRMLAAGTHPDFNLVYKELAAYHEDSKVRDRKMQAMSIDVVRSFLIAPACQAPTRATGKVFVVLEADLMSPEAQNSLLKTLEEPPDGVTIILISQRPEQLLPTTLSRCAMIRFGPLPHEFVTGKLVEGGMDAQEASFWAALTNGSLGRSSRLSAQGLFPVKRNLLSHIAAADAADQEGLGEFLIQTSDKLAVAVVKESKKADGSEMAKTLATRQVTGTLLELIASAFGDALHLRCRADAGQPPSSLIHADQPQPIEALASNFTPRQLADILEQLSEYERLLWRNVNPKTVWDNVAITCLWAAPLVL